MDLVYPLFLTSIALIGFFLSLHIYLTKKNQDILVCPLESNCDNVVHSRHSTLFGVHLETWGMYYYALTALGYTFSLFVPFFVLQYLSFTVLTISSIAFLFSIYLMGIQAFVLREWCTWCLMSAGLCIILFTTGIITAPIPIIDLIKGIFNY